MILLLTLCSYVALYFRCSNTYSFKIGGPAKTLRVFEHRFAVYLWAPLLKIEGMTRREEFEGRVATVK